MEQPEFVSVDTQTTFDSEIYLDEPGVTSRVEADHLNQVRISINPDTPPNTEFHFLEPLDSPDVRIKQLVGLMIVGVNAAYAKELEEMVSQGEESPGEHGTLVSKLHLMDDFSSSGRLQPKFDFGTLEALLTNEKVAAYYNYLRSTHSLDLKQLLLACNLPNRSFQRLFTTPVTF